MQHYYATYYFPAAARFLVFLMIAILPSQAISQVTPPPTPPCTEPGTTPHTPIWVCGDKPYYQKFITTCDGSTVRVPKFCIIVPGRTEYVQVWSPSFFRFRCYVGGTLGFKIKPEGPLADLDWQLYDVTTKRLEHNIYVNDSLLVAGNWSHHGGITGTGPGEIPWRVVCIPDPKFDPYEHAYAPLMTSMPELIEGHEYILMVAGKAKHAGPFTLVFEQGTAVLKDPTIPKITSVKAECSGMEITVKLNKKMACKSLTSNASEFTLFPANTSIIRAETRTSGASNTFDEIKLVLASKLEPDNYQLRVRKGTDANTLLDICDMEIPEEDFPFIYELPQPIFADSVSVRDCRPDSARLYFPKKISCTTIPADGSAFTVTGPSPVNIIKASGNCIEGKTEYVIIHFDKPVLTRGSYQLHLTAGNDGSPLVDECGVASPSQTINFTVADTVNADFVYDTKWGCRLDTLTFMHNGEHNVIYWNWKVNSSSAYAQTISKIFPAKSNNEIKLTVSNGTCTDSSEVTIELDNETRADFTMPAVICPEDKLELINTTQGEAHTWKWEYDVVHTSSAKDPAPYLMPNINREMYYTIRLVATNDILKCSDSARKVITVLDNCVIGTPTGFTPNNDGLNDFFRPHNALKADNYHFTIFNRTGQKVFESRNWQDKWDGRLRGAMQAPGIYVWMLSYVNRDTKQPVFEKGTVALIR